MWDFLKENIDITHLSNYKTPASARYYFEVNSESDVTKLSEIYEFCRQQDIPYLIVSWGTNMLFAFEQYPWVIIKNNLLGWTYDTETKILKSYSQESIRQIAQELEEDYRQDLWHRFIGLPGSIGGALFGNAGCFGLEIQHNFASAKVYNLKLGKIEKWTTEDMDFSYRNTKLKDSDGKYFIISLEFDLSEKKEKYHSDVDNIYFREHKQPKWNSCGSFFKNPSREQSAGMLIEEVWLKWYQIWGAYFSEKHANFLMHDGQGTYKDMLELIDIAQTKVQDNFGIELVNEVRIIKPK